MNESRNDYARTRGSRSCKERRREKTSRKINFLREDCAGTTCMQDTMRCVDLRTNERRAHPKSNRTFLLYDERKRPPRAIARPLYSCEIQRVRSDRASYKIPPYYPSFPFIDVKFPGSREQYL